MEHPQQQQQRKHQLEQQVHHDVPTTSMRKFRYRFFQQKHRNPKKRIQTIPGIDLCKCHFTFSQDKGIGYDSTTKEWIFVEGADDE